MRKPFQRPLIEVAAEFDLTFDTLAELRAQSLFELVRDEYPTIQQLPVILTPLGQANLPNPFPPAYRFFSADGSGLLQVGPRMFAVNSLNWDRGYDYYRERIEAAAKAYVSVMGSPSIQRFTLGFYNRIAAANIDEVRELLAMPLPSGNIGFAELVLQWSRETDAGSLLTQVSTMPADDRTPETFIAVNNIFRFSLAPVSQLDVAQWLSWIDQAHSAARGAFWNILTPAAQGAWKESTDAATAT